MKSFKNFLGSLFGKKKTRKSRRQNKKSRKNRRVRMRGG